MADIKPQKKDFSQYEFRCSQLPDLMTKSRVLSDPLSETAKSKLRDIYIEEVYGRKKYDSKNKYTEKGIECEPDAMDLLKTVTGKTYFKNREEFHNGYIKGTPDIITQLTDPIDNGKQVKHIKDVKCPWSIHTYGEVTEKKARADYYWQQLGYMWLTGAVSAELDYCLVNASESTMNDELYRMSFKNPELQGSDQAKIEPFKRLFIFDDMPADERLKTFYLEFSQEDVAVLIERVELARNYLNTYRL